MNASGDLTYSLSRKSTPVMLPSRMGMQIDGVELGKGVTPGAPMARLNEIVRFGIPGTDMPGHETMTTSETSAILDTIVDMRWRGR